MLLCFCFLYSLHSSPRVFAPSFAHHTYRPYDPLPSLQHHVLSSHNHSRIPCFIPLAPLFPSPCSTYTPATFPTHTITVFTTQYSPFPSQEHTPPHLFPPSPLLHQPPISSINRTGIPIPVINNELLVCARVNYIGNYSNTHKTSELQALLYNCIIMYTHGLWSPTFLDIESNKLELQAETHSGVWTAGKQMDFQSATRSTSHSRYSKIYSHTVMNVEISQHSQLSSDFPTSLICG